MKNSKKIKVDPREKLDRYINVRLTGKEMEKLERICLTQKVSKSHIIRFALQKSKIIT
jgi:hypothetical protein